MQRLTHVQRIASQFGRTCCKQFLTSKFLGSAGCGNQYSASRLQNLIQQQNRQLTPAAEFNFAAAASKQQHGDNPLLSVIKQCAPTTQCIFVPDIATEWYKNHRRETKSEFIARYCEMLKMAGKLPKGANFQNQSTLPANSATQFKRISQDFHRLLIEHERKASVIIKPKSKGPPIMKHKSQNTSNKQRKSRSSVNSKNLSEYSLKDITGVSAHGYKYTDLKEIESNDDDVNQDNNKEINAKSAPSTGTPNGILKNATRKSRPSIKVDVSAHGYDNYPNMAKRQTGGSNTRVTKRYNSLGVRCPEKSDKRKSYVAAHGYGTYEIKENRREHYGQIKESSKHQNDPHTTKTSRKSLKPLTAHGYHNQKRELDVPDPETDVNYNSDNETDNSKCKRHRKSLKMLTAHGYHNPPLLQDYPDTETDKNYNSEKETDNSVHNNNVLSNASKATTVRRKRTSPTKRSITETTSADNIKGTTANSSRRKKRKSEEKHLQEIWIKQNATEMRSTDSGVSLKRYHTQLYEKNCDENCEDDNCKCIKKKHPHNQYENTNNSSTDYPRTSSSNISPVKVNFKDGYRTNKEKQFVKCHDKCKGKCQTRDKLKKTRQEIVSSESSMIKSTKCLLPMFAKRKRDTKPQIDSESESASESESESEGRSNSDHDNVKATKINKCPNSQIRPGGQYYHQLSHKTINAKNQDKKVLPKIIKKRKSESDSDSEDSNDSDDRKCCKAKDNNHYHMLSHKKQYNMETASRKKSYTKKYEDPVVSMHYHNISHCKTEKPTSYKKPKKTVKRHNVSNSEESLDRHYYHKLSHKRDDAKSTSTSRNTARKSAGRDRIAELDSESTASSFDIPKTWNTKPHRAVQKESKKTCTKKKQNTCPYLNNGVPTCYSNLAKNGTNCKACYDHSRFWKKEKPPMNTNIVKAHGYNNEVTVTVRKKCATSVPEYILGRDESYQKQKQRSRRY